MDASDTPSSACRNCGAPLRGPYCSACGQRVFDLDRPLRDLATEWTSSVASFDTRLLRTLWPLVRRPGLLTAEFLAGRRVRYVHPLKLYLAVSLVAFLVLALSGRAIVVVGGADDGVVAPVRVTVNDPGGDTADLARGVDAGDASLLVRTLLLEAFGGGFTWGSVLLKY